MRFLFSCYLHIDLQYCKEYDVSGENYSKSFLIDSFKLAKKAVDNNENAINLRLFLLTLQGVQDARILLSPKDRTPAYEIGVCVELSVDFS